MRRLRGFRSVGIAFTVFALVNLVVFLLISLRPSFLDFLYLSADHPWGIVTSAFTHAHLDHLVHNLEGFTFAAGLFVVVGSVWSADVRRRWSRAFLWLVFLSGMLANAAEYPLLLIGPDFNSWGASGLVYGALGVLLAACILSLPAHILSVMKERRRARKRGRRGLRFDAKSLRTLPSLVTFSLLISFLLMIFTDTAGFLAAGPDVDVLAHAFGFLLGFVPAMAWLYGDVAKGWKPHKR